MRSGVGDGIGVDDVDDGIADVNGNGGGGIDDGDGDGDGDENADAEGRARREARSLRKRARRDLAEERSFLVAQLETWRRWEVLLAHSCSAFFDVAKITVMNVKIVMHISKTQAKTDAELGSFADPVFFFFFFFFFFLLLLFLLFSSLVVGARILPCSR